MKVYAFWKNQRFNSSFLGFGLFCMNGLLGMNGLFSMNLYAEEANPAQGNASQSTAAQGGQERLDFESELIRGQKADPGSINFLNRKGGKVHSLITRPESFLTNSVRVFFPDHSRNQSEAFVSSAETRPHMAAKIKSKVTGKSKKLHKKKKAQKVIE